MVALAKPPAVAEKERKKLEGDAVREQVADFVSNNIGEMIDRLWRLSEATKVAYALCAHCGKRNSFDVPDTHGAVKALNELITQGYGRPQPEQAEKGGLTLNRRIIAPDGAELERTHGVRTGLENGVVEPSVEAHADS